jgi:hypothetical protein
MDILAKQEMEAARQRRKENTDRMLKKAGVIKDDEQEEEKEKDERKDIWTLRKVDLRVIDLLKQKSKKYKCSIAKVLLADYKGEILNKDATTWFIPNFDSSIRKEVVKEAKKLKMDVPEFIDFILKEWQKDNNKEVVKAKIWDLLKDF